MPKVFIERENKHVEVTASSVKEILQKLKINPEVVIISKNNELVTEDSKVSEKDEIKLLSVISGG
ncbi:MAG: MoaD/ThiS family protein [DPANN group archaeon]|nr:MoaD/ThiS family protein [DPANN group archaeon]MBS3153156.1 MoaD/ThiS family protein [Candidatus Woesearchaeota archaeon]